MCPTPSSKGARPSQIPSRPCSGSCTREPQKLAVSRGTCSEPGSTTPGSTTPEPQRKTPEPQRNRNDQAGRLCQPVGDCRLGQLRKAFPDVAGPQRGEALAPPPGGGG